MFQHTGDSRTLRHNFGLAAFLCFTAGIVNIFGVLSFGILTTNVTGHFAYFAENVLNRKLMLGLNFLLYILSFLSGSFLSSLITEFCYKKKYNSPHNAVLILEIALLFGLGFFGSHLLSLGFDSASFACILLFTMGLQNALVSKISNSVVRTTHLTGLFTDLGIELSQLFFYRQDNQYKQLMNSIWLRCSIIAFFFLGCIIGGILYSKLKFVTLIIAAGVLIAALGYDAFSKRQENEQLLNDTLLH